MCIKSPPISQASPSHGANRGESCVTTTRLQPDPDNKHGSHAVKALVEDKKGNAYQVGWVKGGDGPEADLDNRIFDALQNGQTITCHVTDITGGTKQKPIRGVNVLYRLYEPGETPLPSKTAKPKTKKKTWLVIAGIVILLCLLIIIAMPTPENDKTNPVATVAAIQTQVAETEAPTLVVQNERCVPASAAQQDNILLGIKDEQESNGIASAWAVKSNDFDNVWMVAAEITGPSIEPKSVIGVWAIGGELDAPTLTMAVGGVANEFSTWPDGAGTSANVTIFSDGYDTAIECVLNK